VVRNTSMRFASAHLISTIVFVPLPRGHCWTDLG
jgi:hypothetical protein